MSNGGLWQLARLTTGTFAGRFLFVHAARGFFAAKIRDCDPMTQQPTGKLRTANAFDTNLIASPSGGPLIVPCDAVELRPVFEASVATWGYESWKAAGGYDAVGRRKKPERGEDDDGWTTSTSGLA